MVCRPGERSGRASSCALWDTFAGMSSTFAGSLRIELVSLLIALVNLTLPIRRVHQDPARWVRI
jgi:hypothetical protein